MTDIINLTTEKIDSRFLKKIAEKVLKEEKIENKDLSIVLIDSKKITELNKKYRNKNFPTDVLSFPGEMKFGTIGEIFICMQEARKNSKKYKVSEKKELARIMIHGILHLLGYDHEKDKSNSEEMKRKEEFYLSLFML